MNRVTFGRTMLRWSTWNVDCSCLLDGSAGQILAEHVFPPYRPLKGCGGNGRRGGDEEGELWWWEVPSSSEYGAFNFGCSHNIL